jgi:DNA-binding CsgD family transcriptional regulator
LIVKTACPTVAKSRTTIATAAISARWLAASAEVIDHLEQPQLPALLVHALTTVVDFEYSAVFVYRGKSQPIHLFDTLPRPAAERGLFNYLNSTYVLNPFYRAYQAGIAEGVYRMRELAPDGFFDDPATINSKAYTAATEEIGFLTEGWPPGREELCVALRLPGNECAEISLSHVSTSNGFAASDVCAIASVVPFLSAAFRHYWRQGEAANVTERRNCAAEDAFQAFGGTLLSPRERQLAQLLLLGHSTISAGLQLGISPTTVKSHRKNLYAKLRIASQFELFSMFRESLGVPRRT